jgi:NAD(P) transhydrogenase subunit alpha
LIKSGFAVEVEPSAGQGAHIADSAYEQAGATLARDLKAAFQSADVVIKVGPPARHPTLGDEVALMREGAILVCHVWAHKHADAVRALAARKVSCLALELIPRISRAQTMDTLSSQANIAGYKAVVLAASKLGKYFPLLMTAAGTIQPARVVVMGAGVAGLQAIATARRLGAVVEVSDIRPEVKEQIESLGGKFIELPTQESGAGQGGYAKEVSAEFLQKQQAVLAQKIAAADVVITTAQVPGRPAPKLITAKMVEGMREGAVIVDLAADSGGNCELTENGKEIIKHGVLIIGDSALPASMPEDASSLFARNIVALLALVMGKDGLKLDLEDEVIAGALLTPAGEVHHTPTAALLTAGKGASS